MMNNYDIKLDVIDIELYRQALTHKSYIKKEFYSKNSSELEMYPGAASIAPGHI